ncbi:MAG: hypothetical protein R3B13_15155 [Polyangiaceae bacterium]
MSFSVRGGQVLAALALGAVSYVICGCSPLAHGDVHDPGAQCLAGWLREYGLRSHGDRNVACPRASLEIRRVPSQDCRHLKAYAVSGCIDEEKGTPDSDLLFLTSDTTDTCPPVEPAGVCFE